jgi:ribosome biogenesis GTPase
LTRLRPSSPYPSTDSLPPRLVQYGLDARWRALADAESPGGPERTLARIIRVDRGRCLAVTADGETPADLTATGTFGDPDPEPEEAPTTGDWALLEPGPNDTPIIAALLPRRTALRRGSSSGRSQAQVLAANVDLVGIVVPLTVDPDLGRVERLTALAWESGAQPLLILAKSDQVSAAVADQAREDLLATAPGVDTLITSATTGEGVDVLAAMAAGRTVVLIGTSGAGKSTLANALTADEALAVGEVRSQDGKGRHTTVRRELVPLAAGGVLIDTPGLRGVALHDAADGLEQVFSEITELARTCRFTDCGHESEPGCAVLAAIESGALNERRLTSYRKLLRENEWAASRTDARLRSERAARWKTIHKEQRRAYQQHKGRRPGG